MERRPSALRELSRARCLELLATTMVGRVGVSVRALPVILPVRYLVIGERVVFRSAPGTKLEAAIHRSVVAFQADAYDPYGAWGWSVLVQGVASELATPFALDQARGLRTGSWIQLDDELARFVSVETTLMTGRAFGPVPPPD